MRCLPTILVVLFGSYTYAQQVYSTNPDSAALFPTKYGTFENYAFILNGETIDHNVLVDYPEAKLNKVLPYHVREKRKHQGVVYFSTPWYPPPPSYRYANDPAYFINGVQVNPYTVRSSKAELYNRIEHSAQDTLIDGMFYSGMVHIDTEEDFFADRISLPEVIERYTGLPIDRVIVHWRGKYIDVLNTGIIIHDHFPLYHINPKGLLAVEVDRVRFAEGERYVVHVVDQGYLSNTLTKNGWRMPRRTYLIFEDPSAIDPTGPCYLADFDTTGKVIHRRAKVEPHPLPDVETYLKKLSTIMALPIGNPGIVAMQDSLTVQFIVLGNGQLTGLEPSYPDNPEHERIKQAIRQHSCVWPVAANETRPLLFLRKMTIVYSKDQSGRIRSLDALKFKYDT